MSYSIGQHFKDSNPLTLGAFCQNHIFDILEIFSLAILLGVFLANLWAFTCIFQAPELITLRLIWVSLERSFPPAKVEYRWCQFWSKWWCQKWNKGQCSTRPVLASTRVYGLTKYPSFASFAEFLVFLSLVGNRFPKFITKRIIFRKVWSSLTHWLLELFAKYAFFGHSGDFQPRNWPK